MATARSELFHWCRTTRQETVVQRRKQRKRAWLKRMYLEGMAKDDDQIRAIERLKEDDARGRRMRPGRPSNRSVQPLQTSRTAGVCSNSVSEGSDFPPRFFKTNGVSRRGGGAGRAAAPSSNTDSATAARTEEAQGSANVAEQVVK